MPEQRELLLQVNVDAAEEDALQADVGLVGAGRRIRRNEEGVVPHRDEARDQRVVVQAAAAIHARGAGSDVGDTHTLPWMIRARSASDDPSYPSLALRALTRYSS